MSAYKLQKLLYYVQAWSLSRRGRPAFSDEVRAWADGPVVKAVYKRFSTWRYVHDVVPSDDRLSNEDKEHAYSVWTLYREYSGDELSEMTHKEGPWIRARFGYPDGKWSDVRISHEDMRAECDRQVDATIDRLAVAADEMERSFG